MAEFIEDIDDGTDDSELNVVEQLVKSEPKVEEEHASIPDKYKGKGIEDVIRMHQEAEKLIGRQAQEVGEIRKLTDELIKKNLTSTPQDISKRREVNIDEIQIGAPKGEDRNQIDEFDEGVVTYFNTEKGFGFIEGYCKRFNFDNSDYKIPHMGWNSIQPAKDDSLLNDLPPNPRFYFVHSYYLDCDDPNDVLTWTTYGIRFASAIRRGNIWGTQFHPEKSHKFGMALLKNFLLLP